MKRNNSIDFSPNHVLFQPESLWNFPFKRITFHPKTPEKKHSANFTKTFKDGAPFARIRFDMSVVFNQRKKEETKLQPVAVPRFRLISPFFLRQRKPRLKGTTSIVCCNCIMSIWDVFGKVSALKTAAALVAM